jgi:hypothetical protein
VPRRGICNVGRPTRAIAGLKPIFGSNVDDASLVRRNVAGCCGQRLVVQQFPYQQMTTARTNAT